jgi:hypothetical protein
MELAFMRKHKRRHACQAKGRHKGIDTVANCDANACGEAMTPPLNERPAHA